MSPTQFRKLALALPETVEAAHMGHADFRVGGKIFATLGSAGPGSAMVKLTPEQQAPLLTEHPHLFTPAAGAWGRRGCTMVRLKSAKPADLRGPLLLAWRNTAPAKLLKQLDVDVT